MTITPTTPYCKLPEYMYRREVIAWLDITPSVYLWAIKTGRLQAERIRDNGHGIYLVSRQAARRFKMQLRYEITDLAVFSKRLRKARLGQRLTQGQLSQLLGLKGYQTISNYEKGQQRPYVWRLEQIAKVLDVSADYLCGRKE